MVKAAVPPEPVFGMASAKNCSTQGFMVTPVGSGNLLVLPLRSTWMRQHQGPRSVTRGGRSGRAWLEQKRSCSQTSKWGGFARSASWRLRGVLWQNLQEPVCTGEESSCVFMPHRVSGPGEAARVDVGATAPWGGPCSHTAGIQSLSTAGWFCQLPAKML